MSACASAAPPTPHEADAERTARVVRKRATMRLLFELLAVGVLSDASAVLTALSDVAAEDLPAAAKRGQGEKDRPKVDCSIMPNLAVISSVATHVSMDPLLLTATSTGEGEAGVSRSGCAACVLSQGEQFRLRSVLCAYFEGACAALLDGYRELRVIEKANQKALKVKGELTDEQAAAYDRVKKAHERLVSGCTTLGEAIGRHGATQASRTLRPYTRVSTTTAAYLTRSLLRPLCRATPPPHSAGIRRRGGGREGEGGDLCARRRRRRKQ